MDKQIVLVYCLCDDLLKALHHAEDPQNRISDAEVMTAVIIGALHYSGNLDKARRALLEQGYIPYMLSKSRFNRRYHACSDLFLTLFNVLGEAWKQLNDQSRYVLDSFPIAVCENCRIPRCRIYQNEAFRGYQASKKRYFYGVKIHLMVSAQGHPVEFFLTPGSVSDTRALKMYNFDIPEQSQIIGDKAYNDYGFEDLMEECGRSLTPIRKDNSKRPVTPWVAYLLAKGRKVVETTGSLIQRLLPRHIHAITPAGFELKVALFVLAASINFMPIS